MFYLISRFSRVETILAVSLQIVVCLEYSQDRVILICSEYFVPYVQYEVSQLAERVY